MIGIGIADCYGDDATFGDVTCRLDLQRTDPRDKGHGYSDNGKSDVAATVKEPSVNDLLVVFRNEHDHSSSVRTVFLPRRR